MTPAGLLLIEEVEGKGGGVICIPMKGAKGAKKLQYGKEAEEKRCVGKMGEQGECMWRMVGMKTNQACFQGQAAN